MRKIKFRAWDKEENKMCNESLIIGNIGLGEGSVIVTEDVEKGNELIWMQFTGLKDKNGKEIFEGDILREHPNNKIAKVEWLDGSFCADFGDYPDWDWSEMACDHFDRIEVIGNIYENSELLEEKK